MTQKQRKEKKKLREKAALAQRRLQAGMANNAFSAESDVELFSALVANSLVSKTSKSGDIDDDDVDNEEDEWVNGYDGEGEEDEEEYDRPDLVRGGVEYDELEDMEQELDYDYKRYLTKKRQKEDAAELVDTLKDKKKASKAKAKGADPDLEIDLEEEDDEEEAVVERNADDYIDHDNDGKHLDAKITKKRKVNPSKQAALKHASEWFSNPIFQEAETLRLKTAVTAAEEELEEEEEAERAPINGPVRDDDVEMIEHEDLMPDMPKTDKMIRKEKRKKQQERNQRKQDRRQLRDAPQVEDEDEAMDKLNKSRAQANIPGANKDRVLTEADLRRMRLIEKGLGKKVGLKDDAGGFEVVPREVDEEMHVHRVHGEDDDDDNYEDIDSDDDDENMADEYVECGKRNRLPREKPTAEGRVMTLALGTLMLNKSRKKALIDSSYNRYSWSDSSDLPSWFTEDETRHNKPQVPVPAALLDQV